MFVYALNKQSSLCTILHCSRSSMTQTRNIAEYEKLLILVLVGQ